MIRLRDGATLALTKLRTRRIRTAATVITASLLFGVIIFAALVIQGITDSSTRFSAGSFNDRYLTLASYAPRTSIFDPNLPDNVKTRATALYNQRISDKKAAAKKLGIEYDPLSEAKPLAKLDGTNESLDVTSPAAVQAFKEYLATFPSAKQKLTQIIAPHKPTQTHAITSSVINGQLKPLNKTEDFTQTPTYPTTGSPDVHFGWSYTDKSVTQPFLLPVKQLAKQQNIHDIPVIAPISKVEEALGLKKLPADASSKEKLARLTYVRDHAHTTTFAACYRNVISQSQIESAINTSREIEQNKGNKDYQKPALTYGLPPADACQAAPVASDTRSKQEKELAAKQKEFEHMFGGETEPVQQKIVFRTVGLTPDAMTDRSFDGISSLIALITGSTLNGRWVVPQQMYDAMPNKDDFARFLPSAPKALDSPQQTDDAWIIAEFENPQLAKTFVSKVGCGELYCSTTPTSAVHFGSNSILIDDIRNQAANILVYVAMAIGAIAALIMMGMTGRIISDSRRETAVFRAIGAKRSDIGIIYTAYTAMLALIIILVSFSIGIAAALWFDHAFAPEATVQARLSYIFADTGLRFSLIGIWWEALLVLAILIGAAAVTGMVLPLMRNLARSPIKDMRDDS